MISPAHEIPQPALVSAEARSLPELLDLLATDGVAPAAGGLEPSRLGGLVASATGPLASERMADVIDAMLSEPPRKTSRWRRIGGRAAALRRRIRHRRSAGASDSSRNPTYYSQKFPLTSVDQIAARTAALAAALALPTPHVEQLSDRVFRLTPA